MTLHIMAWNLFKKNRLILDVLIEVCKMDSESIYHANNCHVLTSDRLREKISSVLVKSCD